MKPRRFPWYIVTAILVGLIIGLSISMWFAPITWTDTSPSSLSASMQDEYRLNVARAYQANANLDRAMARLALLGEIDPIAMLMAQSQHLQVNDPLGRDSEILSILASALVQRAQSTPTATINAAPLAADPASGMTTPRPTLTPLMTFTPRPSSTPGPTLGAPFGLYDREIVCDSLKMPKMLMVEVYDQAGDPVSGVRVTVTWEDGQDHFVTGLFPETNRGYADFSMTEDVVYSVQAGEGGEWATSLQAPECTAGDGSTYWGSWLIVFRQP